MATKGATRNEFEACGNVLLIRMVRSTGEIVEATIDAADLEKISDSGIKWYVLWRPHRKCFVVVGSTKGGGKVFLSRFLLNASDKSLVVDHINHNTLDNRRSNLRLTTHSQNNLNLAGARRSNKSSGIRGVTWSKSARRWQTQIQINGKYHYLGLFDDKNQAALAVQAKLAAETERNEHP